METSPFSKTSAFVETSSVPPRPRLTNVPPSRTAPDTVEVERSVIEEWYRNLDSLAIDARSGRTANQQIDQAEALNDLRDQVYAYLRG